MGEISEMMLDGTLCEGCGEALAGEASGFPRYCSKTCAADRGVEYFQVKPRTFRRRSAPFTGKKVACLVCNRRFGSTDAMQQHVAAKHLAAGQASKAGEAAQ